MSDWLYMEVKKREGSRQLSCFGLGNWVDGAAVLGDKDYN